MEGRNSYIISRGFRNYFIFSILFTITEQLCMTADMVLVGNFVSARAFSALNLVIPIESFITGTAMLLTGGAGIIASRHIGDQDFSHAYKVLTASALSTAAVSIVISAVALASLDSLTALLCPDPDLAIYLKDYLRIYFMGLAPLTLYYVAVLILNIDGKPDIALLTMVFACILDLTLDIVFMKYMGLGVKGLAYATVASNLVPLAFMIPYIQSGKCAFKLTHSGKDWWKTLSGNLESGIPYCLPYVVAGIMTLTANTLIIRKLGQDVLYVWSAGYQIFSLGMVIQTCIGGNILVTMGSMLAGCHDMDGLKILAKQCIVFSGIITGVMVTFVLLFPQVALSIFGSDHAQTSDATEWIYSIAFFCIPYALCCTKVYLSQTLGRKFSSVQSLGALLALVFTILFILAWAEPEKMYMAFPLAGTAFLIIDTVACMSISRRRKNLSRYLLIPDQDTMKSRYISVPYTQAGLDSALNELAAFFDSCGLPASVCTGANLCCEEMMLSIVEHNSGKREEEGYFFDIFVLNDTNEIKVTVKDAGQPFNPVRKFTKSADQLLESGEEPDLSLMIVNRVCNELTYNYMYGQNTIYMSFSKNERKSNQESLS